MVGVTITYGADSEVFEALVGTSVSGAEKTARQFLNVPSEATMQLNGSSTTISSSILKDGDEISFYKSAGTKGN